MTDRPFQKAIDEIAINSATNGGPTIQDLLTVIIAGHDEAVETAELLRIETKEKADKLAEELRIQHQQSLDAIALNREVVLKHFDESKMREQRLIALEKYAAETQATCKERIEALIRKEHDERHSEHLEVDHSCDANFQTRMLWFFATASGKVLLIIIGLLAGILLNFIFYGRP